MVPCPFLDEVGYYKNKKLPIFDENFKETWKTNYWFKDFRKGSFKECQACSYIFSGSRNGKNPYGVNAFKKYLNKKS
jgi:MoaA/NifB/PqqE/SkfB family radical SAM enzyme